MLTVLGGLAEFERELIKARTEEGGSERKPEAYALVGSSSSAATKSSKPWRCERLARPSRKSAGATTSVTARSVGLRRRSPKRVGGWVIGTRQL
jgi:DNA invertase Pin-like site-specific DNA recombinase